jgi:predicted nucleotidyltransferase
MSEENLTLNVIKTILGNLKPELEQKHMVKEIAIFGSGVKEKQNKNPI